MDYKAVGLELRRFREGQGISQLELSEKLGYPGSSSVSLIETGDYSTNPPYVKYINKILDAFGKDFRHLLAQPKRPESGEVSASDVTELMQIIKYDRAKFRKLIEIAKAL